MHIVDAPPWFETPRGARLLTMRVEIAAANRKPRPSFLRIRY